MWQLNGRTPLGVAGLNLDGLRRDLDRALDHPNQVGVHALQPIMDGLLRRAVTHQEGDHADPFGFLRPWNEVPALMGSPPPTTPPSTGTGVVTFLMG